MPLLADLSPVSFATTDIIGTTKTKSGLAFQPKVLIAYWGGRSDLVNALSRANHFKGLGFGTGIADRRVASVKSRDAVATSECSRSAREDAIITRMSPTANSFDGIADVDAILADGYRLIVDQVFGGNMVAHVLALGGSSVLNAVTGRFNLNTATGLQSITGLAFQPTIVLFVTSWRDEDPPYSTSSGLLAVGGMKSGTAQGYVTHRMADGQATAAGSSACHQGDNALGECRTSGNIRMRFEFDSMLVNGFRINVLDTDSLSRIHYLALELDNSRNK
jgi:hypothetical protein